MSSRFSREAVRADLPGGDVIFLRNTWISGTAESSPLGPASSHQGRGHGAGGLLVFYLGKEETGVISICSVLRPKKDPQAQN